jgi:hypothetical protein
LGAERDEDLQVLCRGCHLGLHVNEAQHGLGVYIKLVSEAVRSGLCTNYTDLIEDVKGRCARAKIPYKQGQVQAAVARVDRENRLQFPVAPMPKKYVELLDAGTGSQSFTHAEACDFLARLGVTVKAMPPVRPMSPRRADSVIVLRQLAALIKQQVKSATRRKSLWSRRDDRAA